MFTRRSSNPPASSTSSDGVHTHIRTYSGSPKSIRGSLTFMNSLALVVSLQIGSGIFFTPSEISKNVPSAGAAVLVWVLAGFMVWTGAASFIELGRAIPENGGVQEYLRCCFGDFYGFLSSWVWILLCKPCAMAIIATVFATHLNSAFLPTSLNSPLVHKLTAIIGLVALTIINCLGAKTGAVVANGFFVLKLLALLSVAAIGISVGLNGQGDGVGQGDEPSWFSSGNHQNISDSTVERQQNIWPVLGDYVTAIFAALFCYGGWETAGIIVGDMENPSRDLPRVLNSAMVLVISGFCLTNVALYKVLPFDTIKHTKTPIVEFGTHVFGSTGGLLYSLVVALSAFGALNTNVFAMGKLYVAASRRKYFPQFLGDPSFLNREEERSYCRKAFKRYPSILAYILFQIVKVTEHVRWEENVPVYAICLGTITASFYILIGSYGALLTFIGISEYAFLFFAVFGVFVLRRRALPGERPYRTWTINPIAFCIFCGSIVVRGLVAEPIQGLAIGVLILVGWLFRRYQEQSTEARRSDDVLLAEDRRET